MTLRAPGRVCENSAVAARGRVQALKGGRGDERLKVVERSALVKHTPAQMFALVDDVPRYPEFLPWCVGARIESSSAGERLAQLKIARGAIHLEFTTRNTVLPDAEILMQLVEGPFNHLTGRWNFDSIGDRGSRVRFKVDFEFKNRLMGMAFNPVFEAVCDEIVDAFVVRAQRIYG
jgi:ribosome-associated toxin RatA of RatAB toxin-antitoxin module